MTQYVDAILYIPSIVDLMSSLPPEQIGEDGVHIGFDRTPLYINGDRALVYVRLEENATGMAAQMPVIVLASTPYIGKGTADRLYFELFSNTNASTIYHDVYNSAVQMVDDVAYWPPVRFGQLA